jgi:hypothetical protein
MGTGEPPDDDIQVSTLEIPFLGISDSYIESSEFLSPTPHRLHRLNYSAMPKIVNDFKSVLDLQCKTIIQNFFYVHAPRRCQKANHRSCPCRYHNRFHRI